MVVSGAEHIVLVLFEEAQFLAGSGLGSLLVSAAVHHFSVNQWEEKTIRRVGLEGIFRSNPL